MDRFILRYFLIILVRIFGGAIFYTRGTTRAFVLKNIPRLFGQAYLKVSYLPFYTVDFSIGEDLNIGVPADLDQLGCQYSHRAVIGGKGLVQLRHMAANAWPFFNQVDLEPGRGKIKRGLNAADASTNNHYVSKIGFSKAPAKLLEFLFQQYYFSHFLSPHRPACAVAESRDWRQSEPCRCYAYSSEFVSPDLIALCIDYISSRHEKLYCRIRDIHSGPLRLESIFQYRTLVDMGQPEE